MAENNLERTWASSSRIPEKANSWHQKASHPVQMPTYLTSEAIHASRLSTRALRFVLPIIHASSWIVLGFGAQAQVTTRGSFFPARRYLASLEFYSSRRRLQVPDTRLSLERGSPVLRLGRLRYRIGFFRNGTWRWSLTT